MAWQRSWWLNSWRSSLFHHWKKNKILSESKALNHWLWHSLPEWPIRSPIYRRRGRKKNILKTSSEDRREEYLQKGRVLWVSSSLFQTILFALWKSFQAMKVDKVDPWSRNEQKEEKKYRRRRRVWRVWRRSSSRFNRIERNIFFTWISIQ